MSAVPEKSDAATMSVEISSDKNSSVRDSKSVFGGDGNIKIPSILRSDH
jgi:hypothetical protein